MVAVGAVLAFAISRSPILPEPAGCWLGADGDGRHWRDHSRRGYGWMRRSLAAQKDEEAETAPVGGESPRFNRILVPGGVLSSRHGAMQPAGGQAQRETIQD